MDGERDEMRRERERERRERERERERVKNRDRERCRGLWIKVITRFAFLQPHPVTGWTEALAFIHLLYSSHSWLKGATPRQHRLG